MKNIWKLIKGMKADLQVFSILALLKVRGQLHAPAAFNLWIKSPRSHCAGCWMSRWRICTVHGDNKEILQRSYNVLKVGYWIRYSGF